MSWLRLPATILPGHTAIAGTRLTLYKRRGIGMFVADGARDRLRRERQESFAVRYLDPLLTEAARLGLDAGDVIDLIHRRSADATEKE